MASAIGIDIGGTHTRAARVAQDGTVVQHLSGPTAIGAEAIYRDMLAKITALADGETRAIGIGVPGRVDARTGKILSGGYVDLSSLRLAERLRHDTGLTAFADNDANMALVAEATCGAARGHDDVVMLTIGTGIGGAILSGGRIFHGGGMAGQLGHITSNPQGTLCNCGRRGCIEAEASGSALARRMASASLPAGTRVEQLFDSPDFMARAVLADWGAALRAAIESLVACFGPTLVLLGGGLGEAATRAVALSPPQSPWFQCPVKAAQRGDEAGVIGAALAALEHRP